MRVLNFSGLVILICFLMGLSACGETEPVPADSEVFLWGKTTLETVMSQTDRVRSEFYDWTVIPEDFNFKKSPEEFGETGLGEAVSMRNTQFLRDVGVVSALAEYCEMPWNEKNFLPMMQWQRGRLSKDKRNGYLIYKIGVSHGFAMGRTDMVLKDWQPDCDKLKESLQGQMFVERFPVCEHRHCGG